MPFRHYEGIFIRNSQVAIFRDKEEHTTEDMGDELDQLAIDDQALRDEFNTYFHSISLSEAQKQALEASLLVHPKVKSPFVRHFLSFHKKIIFSHLATAAAAIAITLGLNSFFNSLNEPPPHDLISEVVGLAENLKFPADFNLNGNLNDLPDLINDSLPNHSFTPSIPTQIAQNYSAYEGRFFLFKGEQGVGIHGFEQDRPSTLYIVKLSDKNRASFPAQKTSRKISSATGKIKRVYAWRDGTYGYAMVQPLNLDE
jgi:hypothetical protein